MTKNIYFDADCLSTFLWTNNETILYQLYERRIFLSKLVSGELAYVKVPFFRQALTRFVNSQHVTEVSLIYDTPEYNLYTEIVKDSKVKDGSPKKVVGDGEAEVMAFAKINGCIAGSNNLCDILYYVEKYEIEYITTAGILEKALNSNIITIGRGDVIWREMRKHSKMPYSSFTEYLQQENR